MYIAICDDEDTVLDKLSNDISRYFELHHQDLSPVISLFHDEKALIEACERKQFEIIFLDIFLEKANGFEVSKVIRVNDDQVAIVFCSSSPDFALGGYTVQASGYLVKPYTQKMLADVLEKLVATYMLRQKSLTIETKNQLHNLRYDDIIYFESDQHDVLIHTKGIAPPVKVNAKLADYEDILKDDRRFLRCHRSFLVNMDCITGTEDNSFILSDGKTVLVKAKEWKQMVSQYIAYETRGKEESLQG
jgi:two-component system response regulator LytT